MVPLPCGNAMERTVAGGCADWLCPPATTASTVLRPADGIGESGPGRAASGDRRVASTVIGAPPASHYDVLGVSRGANAAEIRAAYRELARRLHPDRVAAGSADAAPAAGDRSMSAVNEAYRVLSDPARRVVYDRSLDGGHTLGPAGSARPPERDRMRETPPPPRHTPLAPAGPARVPWKLMAVVAVIGSTLVLVSSFFDEAPGLKPADGILEIGSCVEFEPNGDAWEIACTGTEADVVVESMVPLDGTCPVGLSQHRGRLGMVVVCVEAPR